MVQTVFFCCLNLLYDPLRDKVCAKKTKCAPESPFCSIVGDFDWIFFLKRVDMRWGCF